MAMCFCYTGGAGTPMLCTMCSTTGVTGARGEASKDVTRKLGHAMVHDIAIMGGAHEE